MLRLSAFSWMLPILLRAPFGAYAGEAHRVKQDDAARIDAVVIFGSLLTLHAFTREGWAALVLVAVIFLIARPLAVWLSLLGTRTDTPTRLFMGWFGPKGVASMTFALIVLDRPVTAGSRIFDLTALVVFCSIVLHGVSDTPGAEWIARHAERVARRKRAPTARDSPS